MRISLSCLLLLFVTLISAQSKTDHKPARVLDFGQMYSTYSWDEGAAELRTSLGNALATAVMANSKEDSWPEGIGSLSARTENRTAMGSYKVYCLTTINQAIAVLVVPAAENNAMPANMRPAQDIYFLIGLSGVDLNGGTAPAKAAPASQAAATGFAAQLNTLTQDFGAGFVHLTGGLIYEDEDGLLMQYESTVSLEGAAELFFTEDLLAASTSFQAAFAASLTPEIALTNYRELVRKVEMVKLSCCGLQKLEERKVGNLYSQIFTASDPAGKLDIMYQYMVLEVRIVQGETFDSNGQLVNTWFPVLEIYEQ